MNSWQYSPNIIIILYRPFASGKFISNILSFNDHFCPQICLDEGVKRWHSSVLCLDKAQTFDHTFLKQRKIQEIFDTIPPSADLWPEWWEYELGCKMFWGSYGMDFDPQKVRPGVVNILDQGYRCFLMCHSFDDLARFRRLLPNAQIIQIVNDKKILVKNLVLKCSGDLASRVSHCASLQEDDSLLKFDIDSVFDQSVFFEAINELMQKLGISDCTLDPCVYDYYRRYTAFY
jgi:hypothetical protein